MSLIQGTSLNAIVHDPRNILPITAGYLAALFCDIDTGASTISNMFSLPKIKCSHAVLGFLSVFTVIAGLSYKKYSIALAGIYILLMILSPHRGYSHSLLAAAAGYGIVKYICMSFDMPDISIYFTIGMLSHILADLLTKDGVMIFFPYAKRITLPVVITTGSIFEALIAAVAAGIFVIQLLRA